MPFTASQLSPDIAEKHGYKGMERVNNNGSIEFVNYLITAKNNLRILLWGGKVVDEQFNRLRGINPNVALMQLPGNSTESLSKLIGHINPQIVIPHHHDSLDKPGPLGVADVGKYISDLEETLKTKAPHSVLLNPDLGQWYQVNMNISAC